VMIAYHQGDADEQAFWQRTIGAGDLRDGDLSEAQRLMAKHDAIEQSLAEARKHAENAGQCLAALPSSPAKDALIETAAFAASRAV